MTIGYLIPTIPYMITKGNILPIKIQEIIEQPETQNPNSQATQKTSIAALPSAPSTTIKAFAQLFTKISENLMYYFVPALLIGLYVQLPKQSPDQRFFMLTFIIINMIMLIILFNNYGYISRRHCLPLVTLTIFYIPVGICKIATWLNFHFSKNETASNTQPYFYIMLVIGISLCLPKLLRPLGADKQTYRDVASWLNENTKETAVIVAIDKRIGFYAKRKKKKLKEGRTPSSGQYVVKIIKPNSPAPTWDVSAEKVYSQWIDKEKKRKKMVVYSIK